MMLSEMENELRVLIDKYIGYHSPSGNTLTETCSNLPNLPIQIFLQPPTKLTSKFDRNDILEASRHIQTRKFNNKQNKIFVHLPYVANLSNEGSLATNAIKSQMLVAQKLGIDGAVIHVGKYKNVGFDNGFVNFINNVNEILDGINPSNTSLSLLIETCCGTGTELFSEIDDFIFVIRELRETHGDKIGVCIDTAHVWGAGYLPSEYIEKFHKHLPGAIKLIHYNGSTKLRGSKSDNHITPFEGNIDLLDMFKVAKFGIKHNIPMIREHEVTINCCNYDHYGHDNDHNQIIEKFMPKVVPEINVKLGKMLKEVANARSLEHRQSGKKGKDWSSNQYRKAAEVISKYTTPITSYDQAVKINSIGPKIASKIKEFLENGVLKEFEDQNSKQKEQQNVINLFLQVWGVGIATAETWYKNGYKTIQQVLNANNNINNNSKPLALTLQQKLGLTYHDDLMKPMNRDQITNYGNLLAKALRSLKLTIVGSYRRGAATSKDIDIVMYYLVHQDGPNNVNSINSRKIIEMIRKVYNVEIYTLGENSFMGLIKFDSIYRHVDIWFVNSQIELPYAMVAHTNSKLANIEMRKLASRLGLKLNEKGLYDHTNNLIKVDSEMELFELLNFTPEYEIL